MTLIHSVIVFLLNPTSFEFTMKFIVSTIVLFSVAVAYVDSLETVNKPKGMIEALEPVAAVQLSKLEATRQFGKRDFL